MDHQAKEDALARAHLIAQKLASVKGSSSGGSGHPEPPGGGGGGGNVYAASFAPLNAAAGAGQQQNDDDDANDTAMPFSITDHHSASSQFSNNKDSFGSIKDKVDPFVVKDLNVPGNLCGLIIGKNGETIKKLQSETGVKIELIQDSTAASSQYKPLRFTGSQLRIKAAMKHVMDYLIKHGDVKLMASLLSHEKDLLTKHIKVPKIAVGAVIGKSGETIREIAVLSEAKVQFDKEDLASQSPEKTCIIVGTVSAVEKAEEKIIEIINNTVQLSQESKVPIVGQLIQTNFPIPFDRIGVVVGKSGSSIREINQLSGAYAKLSDKSSDDGANKLFTIEGGTENVKLCIHMLCEKAGIPSPMEQMGMINPMMMMAANGQMAAVMAQQQAAAAAASFHDASMMNGGAAEIQLPAFAGSAATPFNQPTTSNNISTAAQAAPTEVAATAQQQQKDYTLEWIAYYRAQGNNEEADKLQQQYNSIHCKT